MIKTTDYTDYTDNYYEKLPDGIRGIRVIRGFN